MAEKEICHICGGNTAEWQTTTETFSYKGESVSVENYKMLYCSECEDGIVDPESADRAGKIILEHQRRIDGLLTPDEIKSIRKKYDLTQSQMADICGGGAKAFAKYEKGTVTQSRAMDNLIRLIAFSKANLEQLAPQKDEVEADIATNIIQFPAKPDNDPFKDARYY